MKIGLLIYPNCSIWSATGSMELFNRANIAQDFYNGNKASNPKFEIEFISAKKDPIETSFPFPINVSKNIYNHSKIDVLIIPGFVSKPIEVLENTVDAIKWIKEQHQNGVTVASICSGSLLLAQTGLLKGKTATTHWLLKDCFESLFPEIPLDLGKTVIDYGNILMSGSATSFQNLVLLLIERLMGRTVAIGVSKVYLIDYNKDRPDSYMNLISGNTHNDKEIKAAQDFIQFNCNKKLALDEIAQRVSLSKRTFIRRFKNATKDTPLNYIHKVKVEKAKHILENERSTFEEISFMLGYEDVNAFRKIFVKQTGIAPTKYRARYQIPKTQWL